jgi:iron complex transport system ATP-binding protein
LLGTHGLTGRLAISEQTRIDEALEQMDIAHLGRRAYRNLSGGEQQKVQLARALVQKPELLLLDEPTTGLDLDWQERLVELVGGLSQTRGLTVVMTTHALSHLPACCQRAILLRAGRVLFDGPAHEALTAGRLGELYGCPVEVIERHGRYHCLSAGGEIQ